MQKAEPFLLNLFAYRVWFFGSYSGLIFVSPGCLAINHNEWCFMTYGIKIALVWRINRNTNEKMSRCGNKMILAVICNGKWNIITAQLETWSGNGNAIISAQFKNIQMRKDGKIKLNDDSVSILFLFDEQIICRAGKRTYYIQLIHNEKRKNKHFCEIDSIKQIPFRFWNFWSHYHHHLTIASGFWVWWI